MQLTETEIACLRRIADEPPADSGPCPPETLARLEALGLIEHRPKLWAPLEAVDVRYRLTDRGRACLETPD